MDEEQVKDSIKHLLAVVRGLVRQLPEDSDTRNKVLPGLKVIRSAVSEEEAELC